MRNINIIKFLCILKIFMNNRENVEMKIHEKGFPDG